MGAINFLSHLKLLMYLYISSAAPGTYCLILPCSPWTPRGYLNTQRKAHSADDNHETNSLSSDRVLSPEYFKSVYEPQQLGLNDNVRTPWDIGGDRPQPDIVRAFSEGKLRGQIIDAGCGKGENCIYLAGKYGVSSVVGFDLAPGAIQTAMDRVARIETSDAFVDADTAGSEKTPFWTSPQFLVASCTEIFDRYSSLVSSSKTKPHLFDVSIDSGLLHCLSDDDAIEYVKQMARLVKPDTGRAYVGCFSTANPDPWDNPRRLSEGYLRTLFCKANGWEVISVRDTWWARPPGRGSSQGAFSMALWMEARRLP